MRTEQQADLHEGQKDAHSAGQYCRCPRVQCARLPSREAAWDASVGDSASEGVATPCGGAEAQLILGTGDAATINAALMHDAAAVFGPHMHILAKAVSEQI